MKRITLRSLLALSAVAVLCSFALAAVSAAVAGDPADSIVATPLKLDRLDASIDRIVPAEAKLERVATGFKWTEGPVWIKDRLYFAEIPSNSIRTWTPGKGTEIFLQPSGYKGSAPYGGPEPGSNGMTRGRARTPDRCRPRAARRFPVRIARPQGAAKLFLRIPTRARSSTAPTTWSTSPTARSTSPILRMDYARRGQRSREATRRKRRLSHSARANSEARFTSPRAMNCNCWSAI